LKKKESAKMIENVEDLDEMQKESLDKVSP
jgi:hypothetical protein